MGTNPDSIHYRRRWYYVLWSSLLVASFWLWILWLVPAKSGEAAIRLNLRIADIPAGSRIGVWAGPRASWDGSGKGDLAATAQVPSDGALTLTRLLPVAYRRWIGDYIPGKTSDLLILMIQPPEGAVRYITLRLHQDWRDGTLQPGRRLLVTLEGKWKGLSSNPPRSGS